MKYIALLRRINISIKNKISIKQLKIYLNSTNINQEPKEYKKINWWNKITQKYTTIITTNTIKKVPEIARG